MHHARTPRPHDLVTLDELALSTIWENAAMIELLHEKGVMTKQELLDKITDLRRKQPQATTLADGPIVSTRRAT